jgi:hypothetical protein
LAQARHNVFSTKSRRDAKLLYASDKRKLIGLGYGSIVCGFASSMKFYEASLFFQDELNAYSYYAAITGLSFNMNLFEPRIEVQSDE